VPTHYDGTSQETLALNAFIKLTRATDSLLMRLARRETFGDLTPRQFGVLEALHHLGPMRQGEICTKLLTSGGNVTLVVDNLERDGLVQRERSAKDRRVVMVSLTEAGKELISQVFPMHLADVVEEMSILTPEEQEELGRLCRILGKQERTND
jgi:MarR family 2-MHQ and catechol resistance regulon transcriptional repressor